MAKSAVGGWAEPEKLLTPARPAAMLIGRGRGRPGRGPALMPASRSAPITGVGQPDVAHDHALPGDQAHTAVPVRQQVLRPLVATLAESIVTP